MVSIASPRKQSLREVEADRYILSTLPTFYAPLYRKDGAVFYSSDAYGHLCTVTGATWTRQGRVFDGIDDKIVIPPSLVFNSGGVDTPVSAWCWWNLTSNANASVLSKWSVAAKEYILLFTSSGGLLSSYFYSAGTTNRIGKQYSVALSTSTWLMVACTYDGSGASSGIKLYLNGERVDDINSNSGGYVAMSDTNQDVQIGNYSTVRLDGIVGELGCHSRLSSAQEINQIRNATRWRYGV